MARGYSLGRVAPSTARRSRSNEGGRGTTYAARRRSRSRSREDISAQSRLGIVTKSVLNLNSSDTLLKYMPPTVLVFVAMKYEGKKVGVFDDNPVPVWCALVAYCLYWLIKTTITQMQKPEGGESLIDKILKRAAFALGVVSIVSLLSIFLPRPISFVPLLIILPPLSVGLSWPALRYAYNYSVSKIHVKVIMLIIWYWVTNTVVDYIRDKVVSSRASNNVTRDQEATLPR